MKERMPATSPLDTLMDHLFDLWKRMSHTGETSDGMNVLESFDYFSREGNRGRDCTYARKSQHLFYKQDYCDIKRMIQQIIETISQLEGNNVVSKND